MKRTEYWKKQRFGSLVPDLTTTPITTAKRLSLTAQGWSVATTLGSLVTKSRRNPNAVAEDWYGVRTQVSRSAAILGFVAQPLRGCRLLILILALSVFASAQSSSSITGRVTDPHGANVAGAEVRLRSRSGAQLVANTDDNGAYSFQNVAPGVYVLEIKANGFASFTSNELSVTRGQSLTNDVKLSVEAVSESVVVTATGTAQRIDEIGRAHV